jgi:3-hydroxybutyryl-CoA dehydrogenase
MQAIKTIVVCGAGTMGSGIAQVCAQAGFKTILFDVNETVLQKATHQLQQTINSLVAKQKISEAEKELFWSNLSFTQNIKECVADVVIEAIVEKLDAKVSLLQQLATINSEVCILATNTSSISIGSIAKEITNPQRVAGLHFFNPAPLMKLVEVIKATETNQATINSLVQLCQQLHKTAVLCTDSPGFIVNRVARHFYLQAMLQVQNGKAKMEDVDALLEAAGFKMGPFKLMDLIGLDINYGVSQIVYNDLGKPTRLKPSELQKLKVEAGELGKKTGRGFYTY